MKIEYKVKNILGVKVASVTLASIVSILDKFVESPGKKTIYGANPHAINLYQTNSEFKKAIDDASFIYPEGTGTFIASKILNEPLKGKTTLLDFIFDFIKIAEAKKWPLYILGGTDEVSKQAIKKLKKIYPMLEIDGRNGYFTQKETELVINDINKKRPKILFVSMGSPAQEIWIHKNIQGIESKVLFGTGGSIDVIAGRVPRAPAWMSKNGFEWLYRVYKEPRRLLKRYSIDSAIFLCRVFYEVLYNVGRYGKTKTTL